MPFCFWKASQTVAKSQPGNNCIGFGALSSCVGSPGSCWAEQPSLDTKETPFPSPTPSAAVQAENLLFPCLLSCFLVKSIFATLGLHIHTPHPWANPSAYFALAWRVPDPPAFLWPVQQFPYWKQCFDWETMLCGKLWSLETERKGVQEKQLCDLTVVNQSLCWPACSFELDTPITSSKLFSFWQSLFSK